MSQLPASRWAWARRIVGVVALYALAVWLLTFAARQHGVGLQLGVTTALLFHAHSVICLFVLPLLLIAGLVGVASMLRTRCPVLRWSARTVIRFSAAFLVLTGPFLIAIWLLRDQLTLDYLSIYHPARGYLPLGRYVVDLYDWTDWRGYSVEIGRGLIALLVASAAAGWALRARLEPAVVALLLGGLLYVWLLHPNSSAVYYDVPGAALLQFPWRLVAMLLPIAALLVCAFSLSIITLQPSATGWVTIILGVVIIGQALAMLDAQKVTHRISSPDLRDKIVALDGPNNAEFLPKGVLAGARIPFIALRGCTAQSGPLPEAIHLGVVELTVEAPVDCTVEFSQFCSPLLEVSSSRGTPRCSAAGTSLVDIPAGAPARVRLARRGLWATIVAELKKKWGS